mmetsp:Transcript_30295/g.34406  ORF Transcript_30295/g.34406 Transcript_30295/m.34406 type:complete len:232 (+) Transcript_30295:326-1021(+)
MQAHALIEFQMILGGIDLLRAGVPFEELVRSHTLDVHDGAPGSQGEFGIIEPFVGKVLQHLGSDVSDSLSNFGSGHSSTPVELLVTNNLAKTATSFELSQFMIQLVSAMIDFMLGDVVSVVSGSHQGMSDGTSAFNLVSSGDMTEKTNIGIGSILGGELLERNHLRQIGQNSSVVVGRLVDFLVGHRIVITDDSLQQHSGVVSLIIPSGSLEERSDIGGRQVVVMHVHGTS